MAKKDDSLFLFEVLVDKVIFTKVPCFFDRDFKTCINIKCPAVEPIEICDDDTSNFPESKGPFLKVFNRGKSCLFSLKESDISACTSSFPVKVTIYKALPCGCLPAKIIMGECTIDMTKEFMESRQKFLANPKDVSYQALKDSFRFVGPDGTETGEILMFLRISCFGNKIVTQFQGTHPHATTLGDSGIVDRSCDPQKGFQSKEDPCACGATHGLKGGKRDICPPAEDKYNSMPCEEPEEPCYCSGATAQKKQDMGCRNTFPYCLHVPKGPSKEFEEIGSNVNGNELKIKVPAGASIIKKISQTHCAMQRPYSKRKDDGPCDPPCGMNQISLALPSEAICCHGAQPTGTHFSCTTEGCLQAKNHAQSLARGDSKRQEIANKDVFVLKIAKTATEGDRKCHTELELTTPKGPETNEPIVKTNTAIQSDLDCECRVTRLKRIKNKRKSKYCCPTGNKVVFQVPTGFCDLSHKQRAHFKFTSDGVGDVSRDDPCQLMPVNAENYPGHIRNAMTYFQDLAKQFKNQSDALTYYLLQFIEKTVKSTIDRGLCFRKQLRMTQLKEYVNCEPEIGLFGNTIYVYHMSSTVNNCSYFCTSGTQATALLNKCLQVSDCDNAGTLIPDYQCCSNCTDLSTSRLESSPHVADELLNPQLYFFGKKKENPKGKGKGVGQKGSKSSISSKSSKKVKGKDSKDLKAKRSSELKKKDSKSKASKKGSKSTLKSTRSNTSSDSRQQKFKKGKDSIENIKTKKASDLDDKATTSTCKRVCIDVKDPNVTIKDNVMVTISHIKIGPTDICPVHCRDPNTGLKCFVKPPSDTQQGRIKVTSTTNPRRGVFELVVRKLTGAPFATNELLLEWSPPPYPCKPCAPPAPAYLPISRCLPSKCKRVICRPCKPKPCFPPSPCSSCNMCCKPSCRRPPCGRPCGPPCRPICRPACRPPTIICSPVRCCPPPLSPCKLGCRPCKADGVPCRNLCTVGRRQPRKIKSLIKMKPRRSHVSPCSNRSRTCPLVACRSVPSCMPCCR